MNDFVEDLQEFFQAGILLAVRGFLLLDDLAALNPLYSIPRDAVLDSVLGPAEEFESAPRTTQSPL